MTDGKASSNARPLRIGDRIRYRGWNKMEWPSGHEVTAVHAGGLSRQLDKGMIDVRREHVPDWMHADGARIDMGATFASYDHRPSDARPVRVGDRVRGRCGPYAVTAINIAHDCFIEVEEVGAYTRDYIEEGNVLHEDGAPIDIAATIAEQRSNEASLETVVVANGEQIGPNGTAYRVIDGKLHRIVNEVSPALRPQEAKPVREAVAAIVKMIDERIDRLAEEKRTEGYDPEKVVCASNELVDLAEQIDEWYSAGHADPCSDKAPPDPPLDIVRGRGIIEAALHWHARSEAGLTTAGALDALEKAIRETPKREDVETQIAKLAEALDSCMASNDTAEDRLSKFRAALRMAFATPRPTVDLDYPKCVRCGGFPPVATLVTVGDTSNPRGYYFVCETANFCDERRSDSAPTTEKS